MSPHEASNLVSSLFECWYLTLVRYALRATGRLELAEDMAQEAFMLLYRELRRGKTIENPKGWTLCVVRREISKQVRTYLRRGGHETLDVLDATPAAWNETSVEANDVTKFFSVLTRREEEVVLLRLEAVKYREIASRLGITTSSVNTLLARALRKLRKVTVEKWSGKPVSSYARKGTSETLQ